MSTISAPERRSLSFRIGVALVLVLMVSVVYLNSLGNGFVDLDDDLYVFNNPDISLETSTALGNLLKSFYVGNYHPLTMLSLALNYAISGFDPWSYHATNVLLHLANTVLVMVLFLQLGLGQWSAFALALLFGVHPLHVESVAWISERKDVLYSFFYLGAMCLYFASLQSDRKKLFLTLITLASLLAMLSKPMAITLPLVFLLLDCQARRPLSFKLILEKLHYFIMSLFFGGLALFSQSSGEALSYLNISILDRFVLLAYSLMFYFVKLVLPYKMSVYHFYPDKIGGWLPVSVYLSLPGLVLIALGLYFLRVNKKEVIGGILFFLVTISITLQIVPFGAAIVAERYTYIPSIGLFYAGVVLFQQAVKNAGQRSGMLRNAILALLLVYFLFLGVSTHQRNKAWKDSHTLFSDIIDKYPDNAYGYLLRSNARIKQKDYRGALYDSEKALERDDELKKAYINRGICQGQFKNFAAALADFDKALVLDPTEVEAFNNRGVVKALMNDYTGAISDFNRTIELDARNANAYKFRGNAHLYKRDFKRAIDDFNTAISLSPIDEDAFEKRGFAYFQLGNNQAACYDWQRAAQLGSTKVAPFLKKYCQP